MMESVPSIAAWRVLATGASANSHLPGKVTSEGDGRSAAIHDYVALQSLADFPYFGFPRQGEKNDFCVLRQFFERARCGDAVGGEPVQRFLTWVPGDDAAARLAGEVAAHGLAHDA